MRKNLYIIVLWILLIAIVVLGISVFVFTDELTSLINDVSGNIAGILLSWIIDFLLVVWNNIL
ncbi:MAG: hypothetical protein IJE43_02035 [Alphaproteobacteria bacterium]|nr:hypothetical protein [Alphaproteobacteria bacterium]